MATLTLSSFDTLQYVKKLKAVNVPEQQAEVQAEALNNVLGAVLAEHADNLATRADINKIDAKLDAQLALLRKEIALARRDTLIWLGGMLVAGFGLVLRYVT